MKLVTGGFHVATERFLRASDCSAAGRHGSVTSEGRIFTVACSVFDLPDQASDFCGVYIRRQPGLHFSYERYLLNRLREEFDFFATPLRIVEKKRNRAR